MAAGSRRSRRYADHMSRLRLSLACGSYDRTEALRTGLIQPEGIDLNYIAIKSPPEIFSRMLDLHSFDAAEMSLSQYLTLRSAGEREVLALPIFPSRVFRHGFIFVRDEIKDPKDLDGKRMGVPEYWQTAAVWIRGILAHEYDVDIESCHWYEGGLEVPLSDDERQARVLRSGERRPEIIGADQCLNTMLANGELDAVIGARKPSCVDQSTGVRRLFENYRHVESQYFRKTGIFPIMHTLVVRQEIVDDNPWVVESLYKAFTEAKAWCMKEMRFTGTIRYMLPWLFDDLDEIDDLFGGDPWPYGIAPNRNLLSTFVAYLEEQGLLGEPIDPCAHFATVVGNTQ